MPSLKERAQGSLVGLAVGDALGAPVEFMARGSFPLVTEMLAGGKFKLQPGEWTDDTSMALCLTDSLIHCRGFDAKDQLDRYLRWAETGYRSCRPYSVGLGKTTIQSLGAYKKTGSVVSSQTAPRTAGNGCLMRLAPIPIFYNSSLEECITRAVQSANTTHGAEESLAATALMAYMLFLLINDDVVDKAELVGYDYGMVLPDSIAAIAAGEYLRKSEEQIKGSGYVVESLEAALSCFMTTDSFEDALIKAVNLGDDSDTTAAICGQLAGAYYGLSAIPSRWRSVLAHGDEIESLALSLLQVASGIK